MSCLGLGGWSLLPISMKILHQITLLPPIILSILPEYSMLLLRVGPSHPPWGFLNPPSISYARPWSLHHRFDSSWDCAVFFPLLFFFFLRKLLSYPQQVQMSRALPQPISPFTPQIHHCHLFDASLVAGRLLTRRSNALDEGETTEDRGDKLRWL